MQGERRFGLNSSSAAPLQSHKNQCPSKDGLHSQNALVPAATATALLYV